MVPGNKKKFRNLPPLNIDWSLSMSVRKSPFIFIMMFIQCSEFCRKMKSLVYSSDLNTLASEWFTETLFYISKFNNSRRSFCNLTHGNSSLIRTAGCTCCTSLAIYQRPGQPSRYGNQQHLQYCQHHRQFSSSILQIGAQSGMNDINIHTTGLSRSCLLPVSSPSSPPASSSLD